jgi:putative colanic acid biosynthesis acetyltransferase WcaB
MSVLQDLRTNTGDKRAQFILLCFRSTKVLNQSSSPIAKLVAKPLTVIYRVVIDWIMGVEIPWYTEIGPGLRLHHAKSVVINGNAVIGSNVSIRHGVTLGGRRSEFDCPVIGDGVSIGAGAILIGALQVGANAQIGAGAVVLSDVPSQGRAVGNPARIL